MVRFALVFWLSVICFFPLNTFAECVIGDCENGKGVRIGDNGAKYEGEFKDGVPHGQGIRTDAEGKKDGNVTYKCPTCGKYEGEFKEGLRD